MLLSCKNESDSYEKERPWKDSVMVSVERGDANYLLQLLESPCKQTLDFNCTWARDMESSPLTCAVLHYKHHIAEQLLHAGASVDFRNGCDMTPLMVAVFNGDVHSIRLLLNHDADVNATRNRGTRTALHFAMFRNKYEAACLLLENGAQPCEKVNGYMAIDGSPFAIALSSNKNDMVKLFLSYCNKKHIKLPLKLLITRAIASSNEERAIIFLKQGINLHHKSPQTSSLFHMAATSGQIKLMSLLAELNPQFLQEEWFVHSRFPPELQNHGSHTSMLIEYRKQVPSLQKLCKCSIVSHLDCYYIAKIAELPLPKSLKKYLCLLDSAC